MPPTSYEPPALPAPAQLTFPNRTHSPSSRCFKHNIVCDIELVKADGGAVTTAWERTVKVRACVR